MLAQHLGQLGLHRYSVGARFLRDTGPTMPPTCLRTTRMMLASSSQSSHLIALAWQC